MKIKPGGLALILLVIAGLVYGMVRTMGAGDGSNKGVPRLSGKSTETQEIK
jgi:hypothetical protein